MELKEARNNNMSNADIGIQIKLLKGFKTALIDKSNSLELNTQITELSPTLEVASTLNEKSLKRFWKKSSS